MCHFRGRSSLAVESGPDLFAVAICTKGNHRSASCVVEIRLGDNVVFTFTGPRGWGHVASAGGVLRGSGGSRAALGSILGWRRRGAVGVLLAVDGSRCVDVGELGTGMLVLAEALFHFTQASL